MNNENNTPRQEGAMSLMEYLESADPDDVIYVAAKESSCFIMIGTPETLMQDLGAVNARMLIAIKNRFNEVPDGFELLQNREVVDIYNHATDIPGTTVILTGETYSKGYWFWHEYEKSMGRSTKRAAAPKMPMSDSGYDLLRGAIVKQAVVDYMNTSERSAEPNCNHTEMKDFFSGKWFSALCGLDGKWILKTLKEEKEKKGDKRWRFDEQ